MGVRFLQHAVAFDALARLRDQLTPPYIFRHELRRLSMVLAVEATRRLATQHGTVDTPLATAEVDRLYLPNALIPIMRAGAGMLEAFQLFMPNARVWHVSLARCEETFIPKFMGSKVPSGISEDIGMCFILDPMLATGGTACWTICALKEAGAQSITLVNVLAAPEGIARVECEHPDIQILLAACDSYLNERAYIVPGLGDAGDRQFPVE